MKYPWSVASVALVLVGCAVGSTGDTSDDPTAPAPKLDAGKGTSTPTLPGGDDPLPPDEDAGTATDSSTPIVDAGKDSAPTSACAFTGELVAYDLTMVVGTSDLAATSTGGKVSTTSLSRAGVTAVSSSQAMNASDWSLGAADPAKRYVFSVTPPAGCSIKLTSLSVDLKASGTGPTSAAVATSLDGFASMKTTTVTTAGGAATVSLSGTASSTIEIRVLGYDASSSAGTMRIQNTLSLTGQVTP